MVSFPPVSPPRPYTPTSPHPYAPHAQPISFFSILSPAQYWVRSTNHLAPRYAISSISPVINTNVLCIYIYNVMLFAPCIVIQLYNTNQRNTQFCKLIFNYLIRVSNLLGSSSGRQLHMQYGKFYMHRCEQSGECVLEYLCGTSLPELWGASTTPDAGLSGYGVLRPTASCTALVLG